MRPIDEQFGLNCGHNYLCKPCWVTYLSKAVETKACIDLKCPIYKCDALIPSNVWKEITKDRDAPGLYAMKQYDRFWMFLRQDFIYV